MARTGQFNFSKGELAEELLARIDVGSYSTGLKKALNMIGLKYGGVTRRPGWRLVAEAYDGSQSVRLMPFLSLTQTYALEMGQGYMRAAANGGLVIEERLTIEQILLGTKTRIRAAFHGFAVGDQVYFSGVVVPDELNGKIARVSSVEDTAWFTVDLDSTAYTTGLNDTGGVIRPAPPTPPPPPPPVPPPVTPPPPPVIGNGGYFGGFGNFGLPPGFQFP